MVIVGLSAAAIALAMPAAHATTVRLSLGLQFVGMLGLGGVCLAVLITGHAVGAGFNGAIGPRFGIDPLSAFFVMTVACATLPAVLCAADSLAGASEGPVLAALTAAFVLALLGVVTARNVTAFLGAWELMTLIPAVAILAARRDPGARRTVFVYLAISHLGGAGVWLAMVTLAHDGALSGGPVTGLPQALVIIAALLGFGTKAGIVPLHVWLPRAHPVAPTHFSALMSAVMVKVAFYGLIRVLFVWAAPAPPWVGLVLLAAGVVTALSGILYALVTRELKRLLAFSTVENAGIIAVGIGAAIVLRGDGQPVWAAVALGAALLHTLNHAIFKSLLFLAAGTLGHAAGSLHLDRLGGLARRAPWTTWPFVLGCAALAGLPPLNGFVSEWLTLQSLLHLSAHAGAGVALGGAVATAGVGATAALAVFCFVKVIGLVALGAPRTGAAAHAQESPIATRVALGALAGGCVALGLLPGLVLRTAAGLVPGLAPVGSGASLALPGTGGFPTVGVFIALAMVFFVVFRATRAAPRAAPTPAWTCGQSPEPALAWTSAGFTKPLRLTLEAILRPRREFELEQAAAGVERIRYRNEVRHLIEELAYAPLERAALRAATIARRMQSGSLRAYVLYLLGLMIVLLGLVRLRVLS